MEFSQAGRVCREQRRGRRDQPGERPADPAGRRISWQAAKTWKASADPDFTAKMRRVLDLYDRPPADGRVICADEFGPLNLQPRPVRGWRPAGHPVRLRASYRRTAGVWHMIAALDLASGQITCRVRARKRGGCDAGTTLRLRTRPASLGVSI